MKKQKKSFDFAHIILSLQRCITILPTTNKNFYTPLNITKSTLNIGERYLKSLYTSTNNIIIIDAYFHITFLYSLLT